LSQELESKQQKRVATLLAIAQVGYAHWFFGNLYEAMVRIPERIANDFEPGKDDRRLATVFSSGSPVRYYLPGVPVVISVTLFAVLAGWRRRTDRPWLAALAVSALWGSSRRLGLCADCQTQALHCRPAVHPNRPSSSLEDLVSSERSIGRFHYQ
jgi:hypothetical protein